MRPVSIEKREMIIAAKERGESVKSIALWTNVPKGTIYHLLKINKERGTIQPKPFPGRQSILTEEQIEQIKQAILDQSDITLEELIEKLNLPIKKSRLSKFLISMGFSFKKRLCTPKLNCVTMSKNNAKVGKKHKQL